MTNLGAMATTGFQDVTVIGVSNADGSSPTPSESHKNGNNMDLRYLQTDMSGKPLDINIDPQSFDVPRQNQMNDALYQFGWKDQLSGRYGPSRSMLNRTRAYPNHTNHLHIQGYRPHTYVNGGRISPVIINGRR